MIFYREIVSKVSYSMMLRGASVKPGDIKAINHNLIQGALSGASLSQTYNILPTSEAESAMAYDQLFSVMIGRPPLDADKVAFENQLQLAWRQFKQSKSLSACFDIISDGACSKNEGEWVYFQGKQLFNFHFCLPSY